MPTLDQVNKTLIANEMPTLDSLPAVSETEDERSLALSAIREYPLPSASTAATRLLTVTGDPLIFVDISSPANTVKSDIYFNFPSENCTKMVQNRTATNAFFDAASTRPIEFIKVLSAGDVENMLPQLAGDIPVIKVQDSHNLRGLRSTIPSSYLRQPFKQCLLSLGNSNNMMSHPLLVRHSANDGNEKMRTQTLQQFMDTVDGPNPLNFIDCFPPGLFSHETLVTTLDTFRIWD